MSQRCARRVMFRSCIAVCCACGVAPGCRMSSDGSAAVGPIAIERAQRQENVLLSEFSGSHPRLLDTTFALRNGSNLQRKVTIVRTSCGCFQVLDGAGNRLSRGEVIGLPAN